MRRLWKRCVTTLRTHNACVHGGDLLPSCPSCSAGTPRAQGRRACEKETNALPQRVDESGLQVKLGLFIATGDCQAWSRISRHSPSWNQVFEIQFLNYKWGNSMCDPEWGNATADPVFIIFCIYSSDNNSNFYIFMETDRRQSRAGPEGNKRLTVIKKWNCLRFIPV